MYCRACGTYTEPNGNFCTECGEAIATTERKPDSNRTNSQNEPLSKLSGGSRVRENHISNYKPFQYMIFGGLVFTMLGLGLLLWAGDRNETLMNLAIVFAGTGAWSIIFSQIFVYIYIYQFWRFILNEAEGTGLAFEVQSPGQAVGYLFIPLYNIFKWTFVVFRGFPVAFNRVSVAKGCMVRMPENPASNIPTWILLGFVPFLNIMTIIAVTFVFYPGFIKQGVDCISEYKREASKK